MGGTLASESSVAFLGLVAADVDVDEVVVVCFSTVFEVAASLIEMDVSSGLVYLKETVLLKEF